MYFVSHYYTTPAPNVAAQMARLRGLVTVRYIKKVFDMDIEPEKTTVNINNLGC